MAPLMRRFAVSRCQLTHILAEVTDHPRWGGGKNNRNRKREQRERKERTLVKEKDKRDGKTRALLRHSCSSLKRSRTEDVEEAQNLSKQTLIGV